MDNGNNNQQSINNQQVNPAMQGFQQPVQQPMYNQQVNPATQQFQQPMNNMNPQPMNNNSALQQFAQNSQVNNNIMQNSGQAVNPAPQQIQQPMNNMNQANTNINAKNGMNKNAIISCIFSVVAIFIFGWLAYAGLGLGIRALGEIKKNKQKGMVFAIIGIIIGFVGTVLNIYGIMMR